MSFRASSLKKTFLLSLAAFLALIVIVRGVRSQSTNSDRTADNAVQLVNQGRQIFRFDTFGDQAFWGDSLKLHEAIEGSGLGGIGPGVSPKTALTVGLKVDIDSLPNSLIEQFQHGTVNLNTSTSLAVFYKMTQEVKQSR